MLQELQVGSHLLLGQRQILQAHRVAVGLVLGLSSVPGHCFASAEPVLLMDIFLQHLLFKGNPTPPPQVQIKRLDG